MVQATLYLFKNQSGQPQCIVNLIPTGQHSYNTQSLNQLETYYSRTDTLKILFYRTQYLTGTNLIYIFKNLNITQSFGIPC